jgi:hypothetical protein
MQGTTRNFFFINSHLREKYFHQFHLLYVRFRLPFSASPIEAFGSEKENKQNDVELSVYLLFIPNTKKKQKKEK